MPFQFRDLMVDVLPRQMAQGPTCQFCSDHSPPVDRPDCKPSCPQASHPGNPGGPPPGNPPGNFAEDFALLSRQLQGNLAELR
jgi:hypothetical protein